MQRLSPSKPIIIFDIDGVLADSVPRMSAMDPAAPDWDAWHEQCHLDQPIEGMVTLLRVLYMASTHTIVLLTNRYETLSAKTVDWLCRHHIPFDHLIMREPSKPYSEAKVDMVKQMQYNGDRITMAFDDDLEHCEAFRSLGIPTVYIHSSVNDWKKLRDAASRKI